jgi:hypothetical protein
MAILCQLFIFLSFVNWELGFFVLDLLWLLVPCSPKCGESIGIYQLSFPLFSNCNRLMNRCLYRQSTKSKEETSKMKEKKSRTQTAKAKVCLLWLRLVFCIIFKLFYIVGRLGPGWIKLYWRHHPHHLGHSRPTNAHGREFPIRESHRYRKRYKDTAQHGALWKQTSKHLARFVQNPIRCSLFVLSSTSLIVFCSILKVSSTVTKDFCWFSVSFWLTKRVAWRVRSNQ